MEVFRAAEDGTCRHPIADEASDDGRVRRVTLREGLGVRSSDKRLCEAANRILGSLDHPGLQHASTVDRDAQQRLVLSYPADGLEPAARHLGTNDATFVAHILSKVCAALDAAHGLGVIHGAITPSAVRIAPHFDEPEVRLGDFGLGHLFGADAPIEDRHAWVPASPEKDLGLEPTPAEDVYLVGTLGVALLTGRPMFEAPSRRQALRRHAVEAPVELVAGEYAFEPWLADILARCVQKNPHDRFASPAALAQAIAARRPAADTLPKLHLLAESPTPGSHLDPCRSAPNHLDEDASPTAARASAGLGLAALAVLAVGGWALQPADAEAPRVAVAGLAMSARAFPPPSPTSSAANLERAPAAEAGATAVAPLAARIPGPGSVLDAVPIDPTDPALTPEQRLARAQQLCIEARAARRVGRTSDAIALYRRALDVRPEHASAAHGLSNIYFNRGKYDAAIRYETRAAKGAPRKSAYQLALGDYHFKAANPKAAHRHWRRAAQLGSRLAKQRLAEH